MLIFIAALVAWFRFANLLPEPAAEAMDIVAPQGLFAVLLALVAVAVAVSAVQGVLWLHRFTLIRDGEVLRIHRGLLGRQSAIIPVERVQAVRIVEGLGRTLWAIAACRSRSRASDGWTSNSALSFRWCGRTARRP